MSESPFRPDADEPAVRNAGLRALVDAARGEPTPSVRVGVDAIHDGWRQRRQSRRRLGLGIVAAAGLTGLVVASTWSRGDLPASTPSSASSGDLAAVTAPRPQPSSEPHSAGRSIDAPAPGQPEVATPEAPIRLASGVTVASLPPGTAADVLGPRRVRLPDGRWEIRNDTEQPMEVVLSDGRLELRTAVVVVVVAGQASTVEVQQGLVEWTRPDGEVRTLRPPRSEPRASAGTLAQRAEDQLAAGDKSGAIATLRRLITSYPRASASRTGLIDLARLLEGRGRADEARCAYGLFLRRWPGDALGGDVVRAHRALGSGPECDGLRPR